MRYLTGLAATALAAAFAITPAQAYTPESGIWWNPNESGTGVVIEVQDNLMVVAAYVGDAQGKATWYTATAFLDGNALFEGPLDLTEGSQCIGCTYNGLPQVKPGDGGSVRIVFDPEDETKASLTWTPRVTTPSAQQRTIPIERFEFYTRRPEDGATPMDITTMLGEWQLIIDITSNQADIPFLGDVLVLGSCGEDEFGVRYRCFDFSNTTDNWFYEGCRAENSIDGLCTDNALAFNSASGYYVPSFDTQCIVVDDTASTFLLYAVKAGTNHVRGEATFYPRGQNPINYMLYPARGFRSASRTFVEGEVGPSKAVPAKGLSDAITLRERQKDSKIVEFGDYTDACLFDAPALKRAEALLDAKRKG